MPICVHLKKKDNGIRLIATGNTLRRLASNICNTKLGADAVQYLFPLQIGVGVKAGAEGIVHSLRSFLKKKVDSDNAV